MPSDEPDYALGQPTITVRIARIGDYSRLREMASSGLSMETTHRGQTIAP